MGELREREPIAAEQRPLPPGAWLLLFLLTVAMAISFADRFVLAMLVQPIKIELEVSDTAMGIATGFAFSAFYSLFGVVMARIVDRRGGRSIVLFSLVSWSILTMLSGAVQNVWQLFIARFGVGIGEAGVSPAAHSALARVFPARQRSLPLAVFSAGGPIGIVFALIACGWLEQRLGWRLIFVVMGAPGLVLAVILLLARRSLPTELSTPPAFRGTDLGRGVVRSLLRSSVFMSLSFAIGGLVFLAFGQGQWLPAFFERSFGMNRADLGLRLALTQGIGMVIGIIAGGFPGDAAGRLGPAARAYFIVAAALIAGPTAVAVFLVDDAALAFSLIAVSSVFITMPTGAFWALMQDALSDAVRATGSAASTLITVFIGLGLGPFAIGLVSDLLNPAYAAESLRYALLITVGGGVALWTIPPTSLVVLYSRKGEAPSAGVIR